MQFKAIPTLRVLNYNAAKRFYLNFLGFSIDWEYRFAPGQPVYAQFSKEGLVLHLTENERFQTGVIVFVETVGLEDLHKQLFNHSGFPTPAVESTAWGTKQLELKDPFGNLLRFNENTA